MARIVITGANRGIGLSMTQQLCARGDEVIAACRRSSEALQESGASIHEGVDVTDPASVEQFAEALGETDVDTLINNAGLLSSQSFGEMDAEAVAAMKRQYEVNSLGPVLMSQAMAPRMSRGGRIGIITSRMGSITDNTSGGSYGYRMSKAAVNIAGVSLAQDLKPRGIAVALLHPGFVRTEMTGHQGHLEPDEAAEGLIARLDALSLESTGRFWHSNGERLPW